jgi:hypothetical protein
MEIRGSARRHGVADDDMVRAYEYAIRVLDLEGMVMYVGADRSGRILEVGVVRDEENRPVIVHAMPARRRFLRPEG